MKITYNLIAGAFFFLYFPSTVYSQKESAFYTLFHELPIAFVENQGQWDEDVYFQARRPNMTLWLTRNGWTFSLFQRTEGEKSGDVIHDSVNIRMTFEGSSKEVRLLGKVKLPGKYNFLLGANDAKWKSRVSTFKRVRYFSLYEDVDVVVREKDGFVKYDLHVGANVDLKPVVVRCEGIKSLCLAPDGSLVMDTAIGSVRQKPPVTWEVGPEGKRYPVQCRFVLLPNNCYGFAVDERKSDYSLIIDPGLVYSTYLGGNGTDDAMAVATHQSGDVFVTGSTDSNDFPVTPGAYQTIFKGSPGVKDVYVVRLNSSGTGLVYATYLGGSASDIGRGVIVDSSGVVTISGQTFSTDFPTTKGVLQTQAPGSGDAFVSRLSADGSSLLQSTYLGGTKYDQADAVFVDNSGFTTITGSACSTDFPITPGAFQSTQKGNYNAFVTRLDASLSSLIFSTYLGGSKWSMGRALWVDSTGITAVGGHTGSADFPVTKGSFQTSYKGPLGAGQDAFVAVLNRNGKSIYYSTYLGGGSDKESVNSIHMTDNGVVTVAGYTLSWDFPITTGAFQTTFGGATVTRGDGFVTRFDPIGAKALYSTFLGGPGPDDALGLSVNSAGIATVSGQAGSGFPVTPGSYQTTFAGPSSHGGIDGFIVRLNPAGSALYYSTYLGGSNMDALNKIVVDSNEIATTIGGTASTDFPTTPGAPQVSLNGPWAATITRLDLLPKGIVRFGASSQACAGPIVMGVTRMPESPDAKFAFTCINAPPNTMGYLVIGFGKITSGIKVLGITLYIDPAQSHFALPVFSDNFGFVETPVPIPTGLRGTKVYCQYLWHNTPQCGGSGTYSASNALTVTIQ